MSAYEQAEAAKARRSLLKCMVSRPDFAADNPLIDVAEDRIHHGGNVRSFSPALICPCLFAYADFFVDFPVPSDGLHKRNGQSLDPRHAIVARSRD